MVCAVSAFDTSAVDDVSVVAKCVGWVVPDAFDVCVTVVYSIAYLVFVVIVVFPLCLVLLLLMF